MREFAHFLWRCIESTVRPTWDAAVTIGVITGLILAIIIVANPEKQQSAGAVLAKLTVLVLVIVFLTRLAASPYVVYRSRDAEIHRLNDTIGHLQDENKQLRANDQLAALLKQQAESLKKGSLSSRANALAQELLEFVAEERKESDRIYGEYRPKSMAAIDDASRTAVFNEESQKTMAHFSETDRVFRQKYSPRIAVITGELKANGLTDQKLEMQSQFGGYHGIMINEVAVSLATLAIKMEDKEKGVADH